MKEVVPFSDEKSVSVVVRPAIKWFSEVQIARPVELWVNMWIGASW